MKTLVLILNYQTPELTTSLYNELKKHKTENYDVYILDNGSIDADILPITATLKLPKNIFFGGGLNVGFRYILENNIYDSLLFMNSDLIIHGYNFVTTLRQHLDEYDIISPCIIQPVESQCHWKQMHQYNSQYIRKVLWIDFQCPMFSRRFVEHVQQYDSQLQYGWGNDAYSGIICKQQNWNIGVLDCVTAIHLNNYTINKFNDRPEIRNYNRIAEQNMFDYFSKTNLMTEYMDLRRYGENYHF
jgi:hypothetical protein